MRRPQGLSARLESIFIMTKSCLWSEVGKFLLSFIKLPSIPTQKLNLEESVCKVVCFVSHHGCLVCDIYSILMFLKSSQYFWDWILDTSGPGYTFGSNCKAQPRIFLAWWWWSGLETWHQNSRLHSNCETIHHGLRILDKSHIMHVFRLGFIVILILILGVISS